MVLDETPRPPDSYSVNRWPAWPPLRRLPLARLSCLSQGRDSMNANRRTHARHPITRPYVSHLLSSTGSVVTVAVLADVSQGGFRTDVTREYVAGDRLVLEIQNPHPLRGHRFPFVVAWSKPGPDAEIGGAFAAEITEAESQALACD
jgi:hypothetical protein